MHVKWFDGKEKGGGISGPELYSETLKLVAEKFYPKAIYSFSKSLANPNQTKGNLSSILTSDGTWGILIKGIGEGDAVINLVIESVQSMGSWRFSGRVRERGMSEREVEG